MPKLGLQTKRLEKCKGFSYSRDSPIHRMYGNSYVFQTGIRDDQENSGNLSMMV